MINYKCKFCEEYLVEQSGLNFQYKCLKCKNYIFDNCIINNYKSSKFELYYNIYEKKIIIDYINNYIEIENKQCDYIKINDYKLDEIENTLSFESVKDIMNKYFKYQNIL